MMKASMRYLVPEYNSNRMMHEYADQFYGPAGEQWDRFMPVIRRA